MGRRRAFALEREEAVEPRLRRTEADATRDDVTPAQGEVLRLQRDGGNEAVAGVLARKPRPGELDSKTKDRPAGEKRKQVVHMEGLGDFPLLSASPFNGMEVDITIPGGSAGIVELQKRAIEGRAIDVVAIDFGGVTWTLKDVSVASLSFSGKEGTGPVSLTLVFSSIEGDSDD